MDEVNKNNNQPQGPSVENDPEDIFAASALPNSRLTPVDIKPSSASKPSEGTNHPIIELADTPKSAAASVVPPSLRSSQKRRRGGKKTMVLMLVAILVILIFGGGVLALQFLQNTAGPTSGENLEESVNTEESEVTNTEDSEQQTNAQVIIDDNLETITLDTDLDGLTDVREKELGLDPNKSDTDEDGLSDKDEVDIYFTNPFNPDTDGDGFLDGSEVRQGYDPAGPGSLQVIPQ